MNRFVLDTSVAASWFFEDETGEYTATVLESLTDWEAVTPSLWPLENPWEDAVIYFSIAYGNKKTTIPTTFR